MPSVPHEKLQQRRVTLHAVRAATPPLNPESEGAFAFFGTTIRVGPSSEQQRRSLGLTPHQGAKQGTWIAVGISAFLTALILLFGRQLMGVFTETAVLVDLSMRMMQILAFGYIAMSITQCLSGVMRGAGDTMTPMWISIITTVVLRVPIAYGIAFFTRSAEYPIRVDIEDDLLMAKMDSRLITQVIINIVNNAVKYTPPGTDITLSARREGDTVRVEIADTGPGIPQEAQGRLFQMFYTAGNDRGDGRRGLGLGLALCKSIVEAHGGKIGMRANEPHGSVFFFTLQAEEIKL